MSGGESCKLHPGGSEQHVVTQYMSNRSAFNGYHETPSAWSEIFCLETSNRWRTRAAYVQDLLVLSWEKAREVYMRRHPELFPTLAREQETP